MSNEDGIKYSNTVIYGIGDVAKMAVDIFMRLDLDFRCFCDPFEENWGKTVLGKKVISPDELATLGLDVPIFIASSRYSEQIRDRLLNSGFTNLINPKVYEKLVYRLAPKVLEISTGVGCKLNCRFCNQKLLVSSYRENQPADISLQMSLDTFKKCLEEVPSDVALHFAGMYEPFLNPECCEMLRYAHERGFKLLLSTTLMGLTLEKWETISDIPFEYLRIHIPDNDGNSPIIVTRDYKDLLQAVIPVARKAKLKQFHCHGQVHEEIEDIVNQSGLAVSHNIHDRAGNEKDPSLEKRRLHGEIYCHHGGNAKTNKTLYPDGRVVLCHNDIAMRYVLGNLTQCSYDALNESPVFTELLQNFKGDSDDSDILCRACQDARMKNCENFNAVWTIPRWDIYMFFVRTGIV